MSRTLTLTDSQAVVLANLVGNALDQDHDDISGEYLWFLTVSQSFDINVDEINSARADLNTIRDALGNTGEVK